MAGFLEQSSGCCQPKEPHGQSDMYLSRSPLRRMLNTLMNRQRRPATTPIAEQNLELLQTVFGRN